MGSCFADGVLCGIWKTLFTNTTDAILTFHMKTETPKHKYSSSLLKNNYSTRAVGEYLFYFDIYRKNIQTIVPGKAIIDKLLTIYGPHLGFFAHTTVISF